MSLTPRLDRLEKNYIINGDMRISQRGGSFPAIANAAYSLDRFQYVKSGAMVHTISHDTDVPSLAQAGYLFQNSLRLNLTTPDTSIASGDFAWINQKIEGYNWASLAQKDFTLSFWVKATLVGTYCVSFANSAQDRSLAMDYTINSANTWERKTIHIPASPSGGTWNYGNGVGLDVRWILASGTTFQTTPGIWQTGNFFSTSNQINGTNTGATDFRITGVMVCEGTLDDPQFTSFGRNFAEEFQACQRYYAGSANTGASGQADGTTNVGLIVRFPVPMRAPPILIRTATVTIRHASGDFNSAAATFINQSVTNIGVWFNATGFVGLGATGPAYDRGNNQWLAVDAEL